jgi:hypothetical protein
MASLKIEDEFDIEPRALEVAQLLASRMDEEQAFFGPIRDAMNEAYEAGRASRSMWKRIKKLFVRD